MDFLKTIWDVLVLFLWAFLFISALIAMVMVVSDVIRDRKLAGWAKALWILFLVCIPLLTTLVYVIARGGGIADRVNDDARQARDANEQYIREVAGASPAEEITKAKALLDSGAITAEEFSALKARVLAEGTPAAA